MRACGEDCLEDYESPKVQLRPAVQDCTQDIPQLIDCGRCR